MGRVDLHVHSTASDGEHPPAEVARLAYDAGCTIIALTDHDTTDGVAPARAAAPPSLTIIAGCEFSVAAPWGEMHLLGYFLPDTSASLQRFLTAQRARRQERMERILERLAAAGITLAMEEIRAEAGQGVLGRPHAARALLRKGTVGHIQEAFNRFLGQGRSAYVPKVLPAITEVTGLVTRLGGVTSAAHLGDQATDANVRLMRDDGVTALEVLHPSHDDTTRKRIRQLADRLGMPVTGGSDWHGVGQQDGPRRATLGGMDVPPAWLARLEAARPAATEAAGE